MTKEALEKEAKEYADWFWGASPSMMKALANAYIKGAEPREKRIAELIALINAERERQEKCDDVHLRKITELEKENAELKSENQKWKDEWHEQVQKATDEGYTRTLQTIQLTKTKELLKQWLQTSKASDCDNINIVTDTEQFLNSEVVK